MWARTARKTGLSWARSLVLLCAVAGASAAAAAGQPTAAAPAEPPPGVVMHRRAAGEPDAAGWSSARSTSGRFTVSVPGRFDDFTVRDTAGDGTPEVVHVVSAEAKGGARLAAVCVVRADGKVDPELLTRLEKIPGAKPPVRISVGGLDGVEVEASQGGNGALMRALRGADRLYLLTVEFPADQAPAVLPLARRFLESFRPEGPP